MASKRQPPGPPAGGRYAAGDHPETDTVLDPGLVPTRTGDDNNFSWRLPNGAAHRIGGPAIQWERGVAAGGSESWWSNGKRHRLDGPARQYGGGLTAGGTEEYWIDGVWVAADQYEFLVACRGDTRRVAAPTERPSDGPQPSDGPVRPGV